MRTGATQVAVVMTMLPRATRTRTKTRTMLRGKGKGKGTGKGKGRGTGTGKGRRTKAENAHTGTILHRDSLRRATRDQVKAEEVLNNSLGCFGTLVKDTAGATHAPACGVPDREWNETKYLKDALKVINDWQSRCPRRSSGGRADRDTTEVVLVERPQRSQVEPTCAKAVS